MTSTPLPSQPAPAGFRPAADAPGTVAWDLKTFWPSRRGHAFDEFCR